MNLSEYISKVINMKGFVEQNIHWFTTPEELRKIADKMEEQYKNAMPGQTNLTKIVQLSDLNDIIQVAIFIHYDQEKMV